MMASNIPTPLGTINSRMNQSMALSSDGDESGDGEESSTFDLRRSQLQKNQNSRRASLYTDVQVAAKEDQWVYRLRLLTILVLVVVAVVVCLVVYLEARKQETRAIEQEFVDLGSKLVSSFEDQVQQRFGAIAAFADTITSDANGDFPFVAPPNWIFRVEKTVELAQLMFLIFLPRVAKRQVEDWGYYMSNHTEWIREGVAHQTGVDQDQVEDPFVFPTIMNVHNPNGLQPALNVTPDHSVFYPIWCDWPVSESPPGIDLNGDAEHRIPIAKTTATGVPTFEISYDYIDDSEKNGRYDMLHNNPYVEYHDDPHAIAFFPVFESFDDVDKATPRSRKVGGLLLLIVYWRTYFDQLLPPGADGINVVLENTCGQVYTYRVDGENAVFLSHGDLHDPKYDYLEAGTSIDSIVVDGEEETTVNQNDNVGAAAENSNCLYSIRVYPSQEFEDERRSNKPWIYVVVLGSMFVFVSVIYVWYDCMVQKRQAIVLQSAQQSGKLVNTLFPEEVRDQLYHQQKEEAQAQRQQNNWESNQNNNNNNFLNSSGHKKNSNTRSETGGVENGMDNSLANNNQSSYRTVTAMSGKKAIANLYEETTIYFADLVGFTSWSNQRTPVEVFHLLETLYAAFDDIAVRRKVYKIETIGDCYVAATGLPQPQPDHAVIMCKFATDCMNKMSVLTASLVDSLGEDTAGLAMRVGLHSGPVTAGVLRGQKSRFQLFGDTVNTASRMESNGVPHRIQVSQQTADSLVAKGKGSWLTARPDKISAKGKGELQTYFVDTSKKSKSVVSGMTQGETTVSSGNNDVDLDATSQGTGATNHAPQESSFTDEVTGVMLEYEPMD